MFAVLKVSIRMRLQIKRKGPTPEKRMQRKIKHALCAYGGSMLRVPGRERAKEILHRFLAEAFERDVMISRMRSAY